MPSGVAVHPVEDEAEEQREIMEAIRDISRFGPDEAGLRGFVNGLTHEAQRHDREGLARYLREMTADNPRFELAFTFEGARQWRDRVVPGLDARANELAARLGALQGPVTVRVSSALGSELADGQPHGFDPRVATVRTALMPAVRFFHAEVVASNGSVTLEPMAWLGGRWSWLGAPWALSQPTVPTTPTTPGSVTAR